MSDPQGLQHLIPVDQLLVKQKVQGTEVLTGLESYNQFNIKNVKGEKIYWAVEDVDMCASCCLGSSRSFDIQILDSMRNEVAHLYRPFICGGAESLDVSSPPGNIIGRVKQDWPSLHPSFKVFNHLNELVLRIEGPIIKTSIFGDANFKVLALDGTKIGKISKQWSGLARELFTDADHFGISFPMDLDVRMKVVLLGACILINSMYYENR